MRLLDKARLRLRSLCRRPNVYFELEAELRFHLDQLIERTFHPVCRLRRPAGSRGVRSEASRSTRRSAGICAA